MKKFLLIPFMMTLFTFSGFGEQKQAQTTQYPQMEIVEPPKQTTFIDEILSNYESGNYQPFLKEIHTTYEEGNKKWEYSGLLEERKKLSGIIHDFDSQKPEGLKKKMSALQEEENRELIDLCLSQPSSPLTQEIKDMVFFTPSQSEQESLNYVLGELPHKAKGDGKTPLENRLIEIDTEFWIKSLALDLLLTQNKIDGETFKKRHIVLQLEKLRQMALISQKQEGGDSQIDSKIRAHVETVHKIYPKVLLCSHTRKHLLNLATGKVQPQTPLEQQIKAVSTKYHDKQQEVLKEYFPKAQK